MDKKYIDLFINLAQATSATAEQVMKYDNEKNDEKGYNTSKLMRDDYNELAERLNKDEYTITKSDAAKLLVGAMIQANQLQDRINGLSKAMEAYQKELIPKLQAVVDATDDEAANTMANEKFVIKNNK